MDKRSFLKLLIGLPALTLRGLEYLEKVGVCELKHISFSDVIINTLKSKEHLLAENISRNNALLKMLTKKIES